MSKLFKTMLCIGMLVLAAGCASEQTLIEPPSKSTLGEKTFEKSPALNKEIKHKPKADVMISDTLTFSQALAKTLTESPELEVFAWQVRVAEAERIQASLLPNPTVGAEMENFAGTGPFEGYDARETTVRLSQKVLLGADRLKQKRAAGLTKELAGWDYEAKRLDVLTELTKAFVSAVEAQQQLEQQRELFSVAEQLFKTVSAQVEAGKVSKLQQTKAQVELSRARIELERVRNQKESTFSKVASFWSAQVPEFTAVEGSLEVTQSLPEFQMVSDYIERNPDVARWTTELQHREAVLSVAKAEGIPDISISVGYRWMQDIDAEAAVVGVSIPLPFFNRNQGNVRAARYQLSRAQNQQRAVLIEAKQSLQQNFNTLHASYFEVQQLKEEVLPGAETAYQAALSGYRQGKFDFLEVLDAQRTLFETQTRYVQSLAEFNRAVADVERLIGTSLNEISSN
ncbi:MAG: TolC family protein [Balneolaceae bacterium]